MRRRELIFGAGAAVAWPLTAGAQQSGRVYRLGCLFAAPRDAPHHLALREELRAASLIEGKNLWIDWDGYGLRAEQFDRHAAELVKTGVDLIAAGGDAAVRAAQHATTEIPILALADDMVGQGFVRSLAKPGGNTTGVTMSPSNSTAKGRRSLPKPFPDCAGSAPFPTPTWRGLLTFRRSMPPRARMASHSRSIR